MKNKFIFKCLSICLVFVLTACGKDLQEVFDGDEYNDPVFVNNYYRECPDVFESVEPIVETLNPGEYVRTYESATKNYYDEDMSKLDYTSSYAENKKLSLIDDSFKIGYVSKLFDGQMFCNGDFQLSRIQIDDEGFGMMFAKEMYDYDYFALNFKAAADNPDGSHVSPHYSHVVLYITFYMRSGVNYNALKVEIDLDNIPTNMTERNNNDTYVFLAFKLKSLSQSLKRMCGIKINYEFKSDDYKDKDNDINYALMLYELLLPNSYWL